MPDARPLSSGADARRMRALRMPLCMCDPAAQADRSCAEPRFASCLPLTRLSLRACSELYVLCSQFGGILDVVALKTPKMRGQAFVVFQHLTSASIAKAQLLKSTLISTFI